MTFTNTGSNSYFYNCFFHPLTPPCACLAVFDSQGKYVGDLLSRTSGSSRPPNATEWTYILEGCSTTAILEFEIARIPGSIEPFVVEPKMLAPGKYSLQMIYNVRYASSPPPFLPDGGITPETLAQWHKRNSKQELFRSNVAKVEFGETAGTGQ